MTVVGHKITINLTQKLLSLCFGQFHCKDEDTDWLIKNGKNVNNTINRLNMFLT